MDSAETGPNSLFEKIEQFARKTSPPQGESRKSRIRPATQQESITAAGLVGGSLIAILLVKILGGPSFLGDILFFGLFCFFLIALIYAASTLGSVYFANRGIQTRDKWIAAAILEQETRYDDGIPVDMVTVEFEDGRRTSLDTTPGCAEAAKPGRIGWALVDKKKLLRFAAG